jgi:hypothetical protein
MKLFKSDESTLDKISEINGDVVELGRPDIAAQLRQSDGEQEGPDNLVSLLQRVSGYSVQELDRVIGELRAMRDRLQSEGERVSRQVIEYATLSHAAMQSVRSIAGSLSSCKKAADALSISE